MSKRLTVKQMSRLGNAARWSKTTKAERTQQLAVCHAAVGNAWKNATKARRAEWIAACKAGKERAAAARKAAGK